MPLPFKLEAQSNLILTVTYPFIVVQSIWDAVSNICNYYFWESPSSTWVAGGGGETCTTACTSEGLTCVAEDYHSHLPDAASHSKMSAIVGNLGETLYGQTCQSQYGTSPAVPSWDSGGCFHGAEMRDLSTVDCNKSVSSSKKRLCWCTGKTFIPFYRYKSPHLFSFILSSEWNFFIILMVTKTLNKFPSRRFVWNKLL